MDDCDQWRKIPTVNPSTGRTIKIGGPTWTKLDKKCNDGLKKRSKKQSPQRKKRSKKQSPQRKKQSPSRSKKQSPVPLPSMSDWFSNRVTESLKIKAFLENVDIDQWKWCMENDDFLDVFDSSVQIGAGTFGVVYRMTVGDTKLVVKEAALSAKEKKLAMKKATGQVIPISAYPYEYKLFDFIGDMLLSKNSPNFIFPYGIALCDTCNPFGNKRKSACYLTFMEYADGDMTLYKDLCASAKIQQNLLMQILMGVEAMHSKYGIMHGDIKLDNILLKTIRPGGYFKYTVKNALIDETFYIENTGIVALLSDFGVSVSMLPKYSPDECGRRNALLVKKGDNLEFVPITCKYEVINMEKGLLGKARPLKWDDGTLSTYNTTRNNISTERMEPSIPINLDDVLRYPPFEFTIDILDALRLFAGGARMSQHGDHCGIVCHENSFHDKIAMIDRTPASTRIVYSKTHPEYVLASQMAKLFRVTPRNKLPVIEAYNM